VIDKANIEKTNAWPFVEAKKILRERKKYIDQLYNKYSTLSYLL